MKKELLIQVCGKAGHGKTLVARQLERFLTSKGIKVERVIDDYGGEYDDRDEEQLLGGLIGGGLNVRIECIQLRHEINLVGGDIKVERLKEEEEENLDYLKDLRECEQCGERAWDGRICHICGMKEI